MIPNPGRFCIIAPAIPPKLDGIGDYTSCLSRELVRNEYEVSILTDKLALYDLIDRAVICGVFDPNRPKSNWNLIDAVKLEQPDWVLVQYNPFAYGRRGLNLHLYRVLQEMKQAVPSARLAIMFHETYVPWLGIRMSIMAVWQRWQFKRIGRAADVLFFSISPWAELHRAWLPGKPIYHLPVGSNLPRVGISKSDARLRLGLDSDEIVLGVFGSAHVSRLFGLVRQSAEALQKAGRRVRILYIGPDGKSIHASLGNIPSITDGPFPAEEVSRRLAAVDIMLATYSDGVSTRRGAMMAGLQHGLPVVGTVGINTDPELVAANGTALLLTKSGDDAAFSDAVVALAADPNLQAKLSEGALKLFKARYSWPVIAETMLSRLRQFDVESR